MSSEVGRRVTARRAWLVALAGGALVVGSAASAALGQTPDEVIDAGTNADAAAQALNEGCADMEKCDWKSDGDLTTDYGPARIIGDVLYNCSEEGDAETAVGVTDERGESTSVSESISLEISLGFLDLEKSSVEFEAFSKQSQSFSTEVKVTNAVSVAPGWKGWTEALMLSGGVTGSAYITQGIHLIQVKNIDLQFPGYQGPDAPPWRGAGCLLRHLDSDDVGRGRLALRCRGRLDGFRGAGGEGGEGGAGTGAAEGALQDHRLPFQASLRPVFAAGSPPLHQAHGYGSAASSLPQAQRDRYARAGRSRPRRGHQPPRRHPAHPATHDHARAIQADHAEEAQEDDRAAQRQAAAPGRAAHDHDRSHQHPLDPRGRIVKKPGHDRLDTDPATRCRAWRPL
jgi:hypothetical protein